MRRRTKNLLLAIVLMIIMATISYFGYQKVYKKPNITKGALPSKVTIYERYKDEWRKYSTLKYEYQNDYPIKKELYEYDETTPKTTRYDFTIKNGKPTSQKIYDQDNNLTLTVKYKNGKVMSEKSVLDDGASTHEKLYQYANNDNYFTLVFHKNVSKDTSGNNYPTYYAEEVDSISVTLENGLLKKTINTGLYSNWDDGDDDEWLRFNGTYTVNYDKNGIISNTSVKNRVGYSGKEYKYELKKSGGKIVEAIRYKYNDSTKTWEENKKIEFEYTDIKIDKYRYASMINAHIMEDGNTYYIYNWN